MARFSAQLLAIAASYVLTATAVTPNVTVIPATGGCSVYPGYDAVSRIAGPWIIKTAFSGSPVEGFGDTSEVVRRAGDTGITMGRITIADNNQIAKNAIRCNDATGVLEAFAPIGVSGYNWNALSLSPYPYDAEIMWGVEGPAIEAYYHDVAGQGPIYLGSKNVTKWGIVRVDASESEDGIAYWNLRLLGPDSSLPSNAGSALNPSVEVETFITIAV